MKHFSLLTVFLHLSQTILPSFVGRCCMRLGRFAQWPTNKHVVRDCASISFHKWTQELDYHIVSAPGSSAEAIFEMRSLIGNHCASD